MAVHHHAKANCPYMDDFDGQGTIKIVVIRGLQQLVWKLDVGIFASRRVRMVG